MPCRFPPLYEGVPSYKSYWSKSWPFKPHPNFESHKYINYPKFKPTFDDENCPHNMYYIMQWEYSRMWHRELKDYLKKRRMGEVKKIFRPIIPPPKKVDPNTKQPFKLKKFSNIKNRFKDSRKCWDKLREKD